jgi:hypothetical protein
LVPNSEGLRFEGGANMIDSINWHEAEDADARAMPKLIEEAKAGNRESALRLLDIFCAMVDSGRPPYPELLSYLSGRLAGVLDGKDANQALGIKKPRHARVGPKGWIHESGMSCWRWR